MVIDQKFIETRKARYYATIFAVPTCPLHFIASCAAVIALPPASLLPALGIPPLIDVDGLGLINGRRAGDGVGEGLDVVEISVVGPLGL